MIHQSFLSKISGGNNENFFHSYEENNTKRDFKKKAQTSVNVTNSVALGILSVCLVQFDILILMQVSNSHPDGESLEK